MFNQKLFSRITFIILFFVLIFSSFSQNKTGEESKKNNVGLVNIPFSVSDREGRSIPGLNLNNFTLFEDGQPKKIEFLSTQDAPLNIVLLLDSSKSAREIIERIKNAAAEFVKQLKPSDRCMIISFDEKAVVRSEFTSDLQKLNSAIKEIEMSEKFGTLMRDSLFVTVNKEIKRVKGRKAIILITDGKDAGSSVNKTDLIHRLQESDAPVYSIYYETINYIPTFIKTKNESNQNKNQPAPLSQKQINQIKIDQEKKNLEATEFLKQISEVTGGRIYLQEINNLQEAFVKISDELRKQYLLSFYTTEAKYDVSKHEIKIRVNKSNAVVRTKNYTRLR